MGPGVDGAWCGSPSNKPRLGDHKAIGDVGHVLQEGSPVDSGLSGYLGGRAVPGRKVP
jgi:hypothetical protein